MRFRDFGRCEIDSVSRDGRIRRARDGERTLETDSETGHPGGDRINFMVRDIPHHKWILRMRGIELAYAVSTCLARGNQVDGLPRATSVGHIKSKSGRAPILGCS